MKIMNSTQRMLLALGAASLALAGCSKISPLAPPAVKSGTADFSRYVAMGTSVSAGFESGGLVDHHQTHGFAYLFAQQAGTPSFTIPSISADGIPPLLQVVSLSPLIVSSVGRTLGAPTNIAQPYAYSDMGIPGAVLFDVADTSAYDTYPNPVGRQNFTFFNIIQRNRGSILAQVASLSPTFISFEYGANEVLGPATNGSGVPGLDAATYQALLDTTLIYLHLAAPNAKAAIMNVPDVTTVPYVTTFPPFALDANGDPLIVGGQLVSLIGPSGPLTTSDYVLLGAGDSLAVGTGFPVGTYSYVSLVPGNGRPLLDSQVLSSVEALAISSTVNGYNTAISNAAATFGMAVVDFHGILEQAANGGISYRGNLYTNQYILGGLFSLDGVHPNDLGYGLICNAMIDAVNKTYGSSIQPVDLSQAASATASSVRRAGGRVLPWIPGADRRFAPIFPWRDGSMAGITRLSPAAGPLHSARPGRTGVTW
jgi:hypothetical protein